ncbi:hypothetical protein ACP70R_015104 [Stipagrostis hirtigluma subsp. patula]
MERAIAATMASEASSPAPKKRAKPEEEKVAATTEAKEAVPEAASEEVKSAMVGARKKRTKLVTISREACEIRLRQPPSPRSPACPAFLTDALDHITNPKLREHLIARAAMYKAASDKFIDRDMSVRE